MAPPDTQLMDQMLVQLARDGLIPKMPTFRDFGMVSKETYHDFATYLYVLDPWASRPYQTPPGPQPVPSGELSVPAAIPSGGSAMLDPPALQWLQEEAAQVVETFIA